MAKLTKADILKGVNNVRTQYFDKLGGEIDVRPLTEGEWAEIEALRSSGAKIKGKPTFDRSGNLDIKSMQQSLQVEIDSKELQLMEFEAKAKAVAWGLSTSPDNQWTVEEVKQLRPVGVVDDIAEFIFKISGVTEEGAEEARNFRQE